MSKLRPFVITYKAFATVVVMAEDEEQALDEAQDHSTLDWGDFEMDEGTQREVEISEVRRELSCANAVQYDLEEAWKEAQRNPNSKEPVELPEELE